MHKRTAHPKPPQTIKLGHNPLPFPATGTRYLRERRDIPQRAARGARHSLLSERVHDEAIDAAVKLWGVNKARLSEDCAMRGRSIRLSRTTVERLEPNQRGAKGRLGTYRRPPSPTPSRIARGCHQAGCTV